MTGLSFRSPLRKLVVFFRDSRDKWKKKCQDAKYEIKLLKRRYANLQKNHDRSGSSSIADQNYAARLALRGASYRLSSSARERRYTLLTRPKQIDVNFT